MSSSPGILGVSGAGAGPESRARMDTPKLPTPQSLRSPF